jgi:hypothetical protein
MSYVTVSKGKLGSVALPANPPGHVGSTRVKTTSAQHKLAPHVSSCDGATSGRF